VVAAGSREAEAAHGGPLKEVMRRARVEEGEEALALNHHMDHHTILHLNPCQRMQRNHQCVSHGIHVRGGRVCGLPIGNHAAVIDVVARLKVEQALALMTVCRCGIWSRH
jgi:hypothetical protein